MRVSKLLQGPYFRKEGQYSEVSDIYFLDNPDIPHLCPQRWTDLFQFKKVENGRVCSPSKKKSMA